MQTVESHNAALTGQLTLSPDPASLETEQDTNKKKSSNKPEDQETKLEPNRKQKIRAKLTDDLWKRYQDQTLSMKDRQWMATLLAKLTDKKKPLKKGLFT